jgi:hypothetical protein
MNYLFPNIQRAQQVGGCEDHKIARHRSLTVQALSAFCIPKAG